MSEIKKEMKVAEIARVWPATMAVFARYNLDLCCGGAHPLEYVAKKHGLDVDKILDELNRAATEPISAT